MLNHARLRDVPGVVARAPPMRYNFIRISSGNPVASFADLPHTEPARAARFFLPAAIAIAIVIVAGFSVQLAMGRSSFSSPLLVHAHAVVFMGWVALYLLQNIFATTGSMTLHRRLGWIGAVWIAPMVMLGCMVTVAMVRRGHVPFFFQPAHFLIFDPLAVFTFAGLAASAILLRRQTEWHRRPDRHFCSAKSLISLEIAPTGEYFPDDGGLGKGGFHACRSQSR